MKVLSGTIRLAATDLSNHLACSHLTSLDLGLAHGVLQSPDWKSPDLAVIQELGLRHEQNYLRSLVASGLKVVIVKSMEELQALADTLSQMQAGADVIAQGALSNGFWFGRPDVLQKVGQGSNFGDWSYEVYDCKLARETKATTILQLALYSELLSEIQSEKPEFMYVIPPGNNFEA